jgi:uncharacterized protein YqjF (DUF2071 family)
MAQKWHDLLFAHWQVPADALRKLLPKALELDTFSGQAWISIVPFTMSGVRLRGTPALPRFSAFPELNVRTYVTAGGKPGVWFFSLDAANPVAVEIARRWFHLPYFRSRMNSRVGPQGIVYSAFRIDRRGNNEQLEATYRAYGPSLACKAGTLEYFLTERYCLYAEKLDGTLLRSEIHHAPWSLHEAHASFAANTMTKNLGIDTSAPPSLLHFSKSRDVIVWPPKKIRS